MQHSRTATRTSTGTSTTASSAIEPEGGGKLIVNRHVPNREIWVAARSGGFHFRAVDGQWRDTRNGDELGAALTALLATHAGLDVRLDDLRAPPA